VQAQSSLESACPKCRANVVSASRECPACGFDLGASLLADVQQSGRVDLYGMDELAADLYLSTRYTEVMAHDAIRLSVLRQLLDKGYAEVVEGGGVRFTKDDAIALLRKMAGWRTLVRDRDVRLLARCLLHEWEDSGSVRLSVLPADLTSPPVQRKAPNDDVAVPSLAASTEPPWVVMLAQMQLVVLLPRHKQAVEQAFGVRDGQWGHDAKVRFVRAFHRFMAEGDAPTAVAREAFKGVAGASPEAFNAELTDEMRALFNSVCEWAATGDPGTLSDVQASERVGSEERPASAEQLSSLLPSWDAPALVDHDSPEDGNENGGSDDARLGLEGRATFIRDQVLNAGLALRCDVNLSTADSGRRVVLVSVETYGTEMIPVQRIEQLAREWLLPRD
jgi:hypothetical protein